MLLNKRDEIITDPKSMVDLLQEQFSSVFRDPDNRLSRCSKSPVHGSRYNATTNWRGICYSDEDIISAISAISPDSGCGPDGVPGVTQDPPASWNCDYTERQRKLWRYPYIHQGPGVRLYINSWSTVVLVIVCLVSLPLHARLTSLDTWTSPFGPGSRPLCDHIPRAWTLLNTLLITQLLTKLSCEPYSGFLVVWLLGLLEYEYITNYTSLIVPCDVIPVRAQNPRFPVVGHRKNEAKRIRNDEVIKHLVYLVSVIDWVLNDNPITAP